MATGLLRTPELGPCKIDLHSYQQEAVDAVRREYANGIKRTMLVMGTGTGKTITFGYITRKVIEKGGRALILAHRRELIDQAVNKLDLLGVECGVEMADQFARSLFEPQAVAASVQSLHPKRLATFPRDYFSFVVVDETHHAKSDNETYQRVLKYFNGAHVLGVTATPEPADGSDLGEVFQSVAYEFNLLDAINHPEGPFLAKPIADRVNLDIDLRGMRPRKGDFDINELDERIAPIVDVLANAIKPEIGARKTIVFTPGVRSAQGLASALDSIGVRAVWVSGDDPQRNRKMAMYSAGEVQVLVNCAVATEGYDDPATSCIVLARPTKSAVLVNQMIGRGTRLFPNKDYCKVLEFGWIIEKDMLATSICLVDRTNLDSEVMDIAAELAKGQKTVDIMDIVEKAKRVLQDRKEQRIKQEALRVQARERTIKYRKVSYDPLSTCDVLGIPWRGPKAASAVIHRASPGQVKLLERLGVNDAPNLSRARAKTMIDYILVRSKAGLATPKQVGHMVANGVDADAARAMTKKEASAKLDELWGKRA